MARPNKAGIEYFPLNTDIDQDDKLQMIEAKYPEHGFAIIIKLLMKIYKEGGYFYHWGEKEQLLFAKRIPKTNLEYIQKVINDAAKWELFDQEIYTKYNVLTSNGIQKRFFEIAQRRTRIDIVAEYWVNVDSNLQDVNINLKNVDGGTQRKGKEIKGKEIKGKESKTGVTSIPPKILFDIYLELNENLPQPKAFSKDREKKCRVRLQNKSFLEDFKSAVRIAQITPFLCGSKGWTADFGWFIANDINVLNVIEGKYSDGKPLIDTRPTYQRVKEYNPDD